MRSLHGITKLCNKVGEHTNFYSRAYPKEDTNNFVEMLIIIHLLIHILNTAVSFVLFCHPLLMIQSEES